ncbi:MAG: hypothetical protein HYX34_15220 [Actinobacteria bacterium]|nr:hypothetical protein [Actinomycetota bacterium]
MSIDERARHDLYLAFESLLGSERADHLMEMLPPVGWADVATKSDLHGLEERMDLRFQATAGDLQRLEERMDLRFQAVADELHGLEERMDLRFQAVADELHGLEERTKARFETVDHSIESAANAVRAELHTAIREQTRTLMLGLIAALATMTSISLTAIALTR